MLQLARASGAVAQRRGGVHDLAFLTRCVARRGHAATQGLGRKIATERVQARIETFLAHARASSRRTSNTARAPWASPPLGPSARAAGRHP